MKIIPATYEMISGLCDGKTAVRAIAAVEGDKVLGVAGISYKKNCQVVFSNLSDDLKKRPKEMIKAWKILMEMIEERKLPTYAICDFTIPKAANFLLHLGFEPYNGTTWIRRT